MLAALALLLAVATPSPIDVRSIDPPTSLEGPWQCFVGDDARFADAAFDDSAWTTLALPDSERACIGPVVWLRRRITVAEPFASRPLGFSPGVVEGAYEVFVDGVEIGGRGDIDAGIDAPRVGGAFAIPRLALVDGEALIAIRIGNAPELFKADPSRHLVPAGPIMVGQMPGVDDRAKSAVERSVTERTLGFIALSLVFAFIALYHILLWSLRRDLTGYLWFGIGGVFVTSWLFIVELRGTPLLPINATTAGVVGNFVGALTNAVFANFFWYFVRKRPPTKGWRIYQLSLVVVAFLGFIPDVGLAMTVSTPVILLKIALPIASAVFLLVSALKGYKDAWIIFVGVVVAAIAAPLQAMVMQSGTSTAVSPGAFAFLFFMLVMAVALAVQFTRTLNDIDIKNHELRDTNASIARFVPFGFLEALDKRSVREVERGDARQQEMAVMFCDVRGFTTLAEKLGPDQTFRFINEYLARMEPEIYRGAGFINQYLGDGIMALFPSSSSSSSAATMRSGADGAVVAAIGMCGALDRINAARAQDGKDAIKIGIGVHIGPLMIGTIGGGEQLDGGVVGDCVNASARLEGMTKMYGARVLVSGDVVGKLVQSTPTLRHLDTVVAKGKAAPMAIYEILDVDPRREQKADTLAVFTEAQRAYRAGEFDVAVAAFDRVLAVDPSDGAARLLRDRCSELTTSRPPEWSGVYALLSK